jgi:hypothetical protein
MPQRLSRRQVLNGGLSALVAGAALPAAAQSPLPTWIPSSPPVGAAPPPRGLAAVTRVLSGVGVYIGNDWYDWDDNARRFAMARVRGWGFDFICPKVGGYARTTYRDEGQLRGWAEAARGIGLGFAPFIYSIPETSVGDAQICAQIANVVGIANVDLEDEWGAREKGQTPGYQGAAMAEFGRIYRSEAGDRPIIANGYGDPITRFGQGVAGFPNAEMAAWADAYSPQWYIGVYSRYKKGGVPAALAWGKSEVTEALGDGFPLAPSVSLSSSYSPDGLLPLPDTLALMAAMRTYNAPVFVWEYNQITPAHAEALLGPPDVRNLRVGRSRPNSFSVLWDSHVPARAALTCQMPDGNVKPSESKSPGLTHSESADNLAPGTAYAVTVQSVSGGGASPVVPVMVATAPITPGIYAQSAVAARRADGHIVVTVTLLNSADAEALNVQVTSVTIEGGTLLSPTTWPQTMGTLGKRDWQASARDRAELPLVIADVAAGSAALTLHLAGSAGSGSLWTATLPLAVG